MSERTFSYCLAYLAAYCKDKGIDPKKVTILLPEEEVCRVMREINWLSEGPASMPRFIPASFKYMGITVRKK